MQISLYHVLIENIQEGALTISQEGMILYGNTAFAAMRGIPLEALIGTNLREHICPRDKDQFGRLILNAHKTPLRCEMSICSPDGSFPILIAMASLILDGIEKISAVVTDRRKDYKRLRSRVGCWTRSPMRSLPPIQRERLSTGIMLNKDLSGFSREEAIGRDLVSVAVPEISTEESGKILGRLMGGEIVRGV